MTGRAASIYYAYASREGSMLHIGESHLRRFTGRAGPGKFEPPRKLHAFRDRSVALRPIPIRMEISLDRPAG